MRICLLIPRQAFFNQPRVEILGPINIAELRTATVCVAWSELEGLVGRYAGSFISPGLTGDGLTGSDRQEFCRAALRDGRATAWVDLETTIVEHMAKDESSCGDTAC